MYCTKIQTAAYRLDFHKCDIYWAVLAFIFFIIGILVEWKRIIDICTQGPKVNIVFLVIALIAVLVAMIPNTTLMNIINIVISSSLRWHFCFTFTASSIRTALSILGGIFLVRSFSN